MKLKAALVGLGKQARKYHLPGILASENAELVAVCDIDKLLVDQYSSQLGIPGYYSVEDLLDHEKIDFLIIATPHNTHLKIIKMAASKGIHVLKEKPFAKNLNEALEIMGIVKKTDIELMVTLQRRFSTIYSRFFQYFKEIGKPSFIDIRYSLFAENPHPEWRGNHEQSGGGCILDMGYHMIDLLVWYFGLPKSIYSNYSSVSKNDIISEVEDSASVIFDYGNGCTGNMVLSRFSPPKTEYVRIIGQEGVLEILKDRINLYGLNGEIAECLVAKTLSDELSAAKQIDHFCSVLSGSKENISNPLNHINHMLFIEACYKSGREKRMVNPRELLLSKLQGVDAI